MADRRPMTLNLAYIAGCIAIMLFVVIRVP
jgi:hypothetical protein